MIHFLLNNQETCCRGRARVLDRLGNDLGLAGNLEGRSCGTCPVLLGEPLASGLAYRLANPRGLPVEALAGCHLVTAEGLESHGRTSPLWQTLGREGAALGMDCALGMAMALTACLLAHGPDDPHAWERPLPPSLLEDNPCLRGAGPALLQARDMLRARGRTPGGPGGPRLRDLVDHGLLPAYFIDAPNRLKALSSHLRARSEFGLPALALPRAQAQEEPDPRLLDHDLVIAGGQCRAGARLPLEDLMASAEIEARMPGWQQAGKRLAALLPEAPATVGGCLAGAAASGGLAVMLMALDASVEVIGEHGPRQAPLAAFLAGRHQPGLLPGETVNAVSFPLCPPAVEPFMFHFDGIRLPEGPEHAAVHAAMRIHASGETLCRVILAAGGIGPAPVLLRRTADFLLGQRVERSTVLAAAEWAAAELKPGGGHPGGYHASRLLLHQLVITHFLALFPDLLDAGDLAEVWA